MEISWYTVVLAAQQSNFNMLSINARGQDQLSTIEIITGHDQQKCNFT